MKILNLNMKKIIIVMMKQIFFMFVIFITFK